MIKPDIANKTKNILGIHHAKRNVEKKKKKLYLA